MTLAVGDRVFVTHQCDPKTKEPTTIYEVVDPQQLTTMRRITGEPVGHYVVLRPVDRPTAKAEGYHEQNVRLYEPKDLHVG